MRVASNGNIFLKIYLAKEEMLRGNQMAFIKSLHSMNNWEQVVKSSNYVNLIHSRYIRSTCVHALEQI